MFGFSLGKLLFTAAAIIAVWYGFKMVGRLNERQKELAKDAKAREKAAAKSDPAPGVEEMVECSVCGSFVASNGARNCGKSGCPYPD